MVQRHTFFNEEIFVHNYVSSTFFSLQVEKATSEMALDPKTRLLIFKMLNSAVIEALNGIVSSGKEAVVFHAQGGE